MRRAACIAQGLIRRVLSGSKEELEDLKQAYADTSGSIADIMTHIPHSTFDDEVRFIVAISDLIQRGDLPSLPQWESSTKDDKAKLVRKKQAAKEAAEAEELAKELGVHDEFFGSGKRGARKGKGKGKDKADEEDTSALQALILKKRKNTESLFDSIAAKYAQAEPAAKGAKKGKKRGKAVEEDEDEVLEVSPKKKSRNDVPSPPDIDDVEFEKIQERLMENKAKRTAEASSKGKGAIKSRAGKGRKAK